MSTRPETIFALSSAPGRAGVAVIRISGTDAGRALEVLSRCALPKPRFAALRRLFVPNQDTSLDEALCLWFPGPASFTGEDCVELQLHGSRAVLNGVLEALGKLENLRAAEPGEFTRRAVLNGKMDLTQAEGLIDLIDAETEGQRRQALRQMEGSLKELYDGWRARLVRTLALTEAEIDFPDEGDVPEGLIERISPDLQALFEEISHHLDDGHRGEQLREGVSVALIGPPNGGKSTLLNALARRDVAITSEVAGTTRDIVEVRIDLGGIPVLLADTAGLHKSEDRLEQEGMSRARARAHSADIRIGVFDIREGLPDEVSQLLGPKDFVLANKSDLRDESGDELVSGFERSYEISALSGEGLTNFLAVLKQDVAVRYGMQEAPALTRARHRTGLERCREALGRAVGNPSSDPELIGEDLRVAVRSIGGITGAVDVEDILDAVFRDFCIGK